MTDLPYFENIAYRLLLSLSEGFVMVWILYFLPDELKRMFAEYRVWREFRKLNKQANITEYRTWKRLRRPSWIIAELEEIDWNGENETEA